MKSLKTHDSWFVEFQNDLQKQEFEQPTYHIRDTKDVLLEFENLLNSDTSEQAIQEFFEDNPRYLPKAGFYHNGLRGSVVISKLKLHNDFVTDFAYMSQNSATILVTCVEIERPGKKIFRRDGHFTSDYCKARQQVVDWNFWAQKNRREALKYFGKLSTGMNADWYDVSLRCILIYGRRSEITTRKRQERWSAEAALLPTSVEVMTYDRLIESMEARFLPDNHKIIICTYQDRTLKAKKIRI